MPGTTVVPALKVSGAVHGGQQPVSAATIQLYAVGTTGDGSAPTALLSPPVQTDANGNFSITGLYTCPSASALVYITATGGNPGLAAGTNNAALAEMAALGTCGSLGPSTFVQMNEVTTVAAAMALGPFTTAPFNIGSGASDAAALAAAFANAAVYANVATGTSPGAGQSATPTSNTPGVPVSTINTLANILAACINSAGGTASNTTTPCGMLFSLTGSPTNTMAALVALAKNPAAYNTNSLYALASATGPFQPQLPAAPSNFGIAIIVPTGGSQAMIAIPSTIYPGGTLWAASTSAACLITSPIYLTVGGQYTTNGTAGCGRVNGVVPSTAQYGLNFGQVLSGSGNYSFYVNVVPAPNLTIAFSPTTLYWIGTAGVQDYTLDVTLKNNTTGTITLGTPTINGSTAFAFSIVSNGCGATLTNSATCNMTIGFFPPSTPLVTATLTIQGNGGAVGASLFLAGTGAN